jgi:hypothetical protein
MLSSTLLAPKSAPSGSTPRFLSAGRHIDSHLHHHLSSSSPLTRTRHLVLIAAPVHSTACPGPTARSFAPSPSPPTARSVCAIAASANIERAARGPPAIPLISIQPPLDRLPVVLCCLAVCLLARLDIVNQPQLRPANHSTLTDTDGQVCSVRQVLGRPAPTSVHMAALQYEAPPGPPRASHATPAPLAHPSLDSPDIRTAPLLYLTDSAPGHSAPIQSPNLLPPSTTAASAATTTKLDFSVRDSHIRRAILHDSIFPDFKNDASALDSDPDPLLTHVWKLYHQSKSLLPNAERLENLTWRMMSMRLQRLEPRDQSSVSPRLLSPADQRQFSRFAETRLRDPHPGSQRPFATAQERLRPAQRRELLPTLRRL